jgi:hypothetical protein
MPTISGILQDLSRNPLRDAIVRVYAVTRFPVAAEILGEARTASDGRVSIDVATVDRLMWVAVRVGVEDHFLLDVIDHNDGASSVGLGTVLVSPAPLFTVGHRAIYGVHSDVLAGVERVIAQRDGKGVETTVGAFVEGTAKSLADVRAALRDGGLDLGPLTLEMKALVPAPGMLRLIGKSELSQVEGEQLSTITFQVEPSARPATAAPPPVSVPDVAGYTETLARQKLQQQQGFAVRVAREVVEDPAAGPSRVGRVIRLDPPAGTQLPAGSTVTIYIGERAG